jgi:hypothetical protein
MMRDIDKSRGRFLRQAPGMKSIRLRELRPRQIEEHEGQNPSFGENRDLNQD